MKTESNNQWRLTWNPIAPAKFESAWSTFVKVLYHNHLSPNELVELIKKPDLKNHQKSLFNLNDSSWIDFDKYGALLRVAPTNLKLGFLDQIGLETQISAVAGTVRHCPECAMLGFNCTLFNLPFIGECPWHGKKLREACDYCHAAFRPNNQFRDVLLSDTPCRKCGTPIASFLSLPELNWLSVSIEAMVTGYCLELIDWLNFYCRKSTFFKNWIRSLCRSEPKSFQDECNREIFLDYAMRVCSAPLYWSFSIPLYRSRYSDWYLSKSRIGKNPVCVDNIQETMAVYRAIRRHIYKSYIQTHKRFLHFIFPWNRTNCAVCVMTRFVSLH